MVDSMPEWIVPMAATLTQDRFTGPEWVFERKFDGIRLLAYKDGDDVQLFSRNHLPQHLPDVAHAIRQLPAHQVILDGELTWGRGPGGYHVFDLMWLDANLMSLNLDERRACLRNLPLVAPLYHVVDVVDESPWELAQREGWEGVVAKRRDSVYEQRRSPHWLKMKCELAEEFVVGGFTDPQGKRVGLGALLVGFYEGDDFHFAGKIGTGFNTQMLLELREKLDQLEISQAPFTKGTGLPRLRMHWVKPEIVVKVGFIEWTGNRKLRHPRLLQIIST